MNTTTMLPQNAISGHLAECTMIIGKNRYPFLQMIRFEATITKHKTEVPILGKTGKGHKSSGWSGTFRGIAHYNQSVMRSLLAAFKKTGGDTYFDIEVINEDPGSTVGKQTVILKQCTLSGGILAKFDAGVDYLEEEISGTFDDFELVESFK